MLLYPVTTRTRTRRQHWKFYLTCQSSAPVPGLTEALFAAVISGVYAAASSEAISEVVSQLRKRAQAGESSQ